MPKYHPIPDHAIRIPVPDTIQQEDYSCGASALQAVCRYYGAGELEEEHEFVAALGMDKRIGSHPFQLKRLAERLGLRTREFYGMTLEQLRTCLRKRQPVLLMIQAWGEEKGRSGFRRSYEGIWIDGHWVVAIGYDRTGVFFEDPSLQAIRGYLSNEELETRWHDVGPHRIHLDHYGLAVWSPLRGAGAYLKRAERIG